MRVGCVKTMGYHKGNATMQVTAKLGPFRPLNWLRKYTVQIDPSTRRLAFRSCVLVGLIAGAQAAYYQMTLPTLAGLQITTVTTQLVPTQVPHLLTLQVPLNGEMANLRNTCSGYQRGESNIQGGEAVKIWHSSGEVYQIQRLDGTLYQPNANAAPCSLANTIDAAQNRPKSSAWVALLAALLAMACMIGVRRQPHAQAGQLSE
jgi:hypothetical protein